MLAIIAERAPRRRAALAREAPPPPPPPRRGGRAPARARRGARAAARTGPRGVAGVGLDARRPARARLEFAWAGPATPPPRRAGFAFRPASVAAGVAPVLPAARGPTCACAFRRARVPCGPRASGFPQVFSQTRLFVEARLGLQLGVRLWGPLGCRSAARWAGSRCAPPSRCATPTGRPRRCSSRRPSSPPRAWAWPFDLAMTRRSQMTRMTGRKTDPRTHSSPWTSP